MLDNLSAEPWILIAEWRGRFTGSIFLTGDTKTRYSKGEEKSLVKAISFKLISPFLI